MFSNWSVVWDFARNDLALRDRQTHGEKEAPPLLNLTRRLHRDAANVIALREHLRLHVSAAIKFRRYLERNSKSRYYTEELTQRLEDYIGNLEHHQETSQVILRQLENLLSLVSSQTRC